MPQLRTKIFISYRRNDAAASAGRLHDALANRISPGGVYLDVVAARPGTDFAHRIRSALDEASVMLVVIGPNWLNATGGAGRRLDAHEDYVRTEIRTALDRGLTVVPVLVDGASMPTPDQLPKDLRRIATIEALHLTHHAWSRDLDLLLRTIAGDVTIGWQTPMVSYPHPRSTRPRRRLLRLISRLLVGVGTITVLAVVAVVLALLFDPPSTTSSQLGVSVVDAPGNDKGVLIESVVPGGPADLTHLQRGYVIQEVDNHTITDTESFGQALDTFSSGQSVQISYMNDTDTVFTTKITLG